MKRHNMLRALLAILALAIAIPAGSQTGTRTLGNRDSYPVQVDVLRDKTRKLSFLSVRTSEDFKPAITDSYGFIRDVIWARFSVEVVPEVQKEWFLEIGYPLLNNISVYMPDRDGNYSIQHYGNTMPFSKRDIDHHNFLVRLNDAPGVYTYYLRFETASSMNIPMKILSLPAVISEINMQKTIFGMFYGALVIILLYNLLLAISMRDLTYLSYAVFIFGLMMVSLCLNGYGFQYVWPNLVWMNNSVPFFLFFTQLTMAIFCVLYMGVEHIPVIIRRIIYGWLGVIALMAIASVFLPYALMISVGAGAYLPGIALISFASGYMIRQKRRESYFLTVAFSTLLIGVVFTVLNRFGLLGSNPVTLWGFQIGTVISIALFSLGLADKVNVLTTNLAEINVNLEKKVVERTRELSDAKEEIEAAMEEMEAINERLTSSNRDLEESQTMYRRDMNMAAHLQSSLLPRKAPESTMYDIALVYLPKSGVSGDFYDFYFDGDALIGAGIFDVSGHGIAPGLLTLMAKSMISGVFLEMKDSPLGNVLEAINTKLLTEFKDIDNYLTGVLLRFKDDRIEYINCAHPDIICRKVDLNRTGKVLDKSGRRVCAPFLGIDTHMSRDAYCFQEITFRMKKDDCVLMFTDSLLESRGQDDREFGESGVITSLQDAPFASAQEILNRIVGDFFGFVGNRELNDDLTVILIRKK
jgi:serine phosphatase RsbU (regulator of sigma subunit)